MTSLIDLRPNSSLLDPDFSGYKLSLDTIPVYRRELKNGVDTVAPSSEQYSFQHIKLFTLHNHIYINQYKPKHVYFINKKWQIEKPVLNSVNSIIDFKHVLEIPSNITRKDGHYNPSICFGNERLALISDGAGTLHIAEIEEPNDTWDIIYSENILNQLSFVLLDAKCKSSESETILSFVALYVEEKEKNVGLDKSESTFNSCLEWMELIKSASNLWSIHLQRKIVCNGSIDYVTIESDLKSLHIISDKNVKIVSDTGNPIEETAVVDEQKCKDKCYSWLQTENDITIWFPVLDGTTKHDVKVNVEDKTINVTIAGTVVLSGDFFGKVDSALTTWSIEKNQLEIQISKDEKGQMWQKLVLRNEEGEEILDPELVREIHQRLAHLCSDKVEKNDDQVLLNTPMEECDQTSETLRFVRLCGEEHKITHEISLSSLQYLFKLHHKCSETPAVCLRHDVDACVWQFNKYVDNNWPREHVGTFSAFGYVQASKTQKKFIVAAPNLSYVAICDVYRHIYIYRQPSMISTELRNRKSGKKINSVAKQQLVSLDTTDETLGVYASNSLLFVLTNNSMFVLHLKDPSPS